MKERLLETRAQADELKAEDIELRSLLDDRERLQRELSTLDSKSRSDGGVQRRAFAYRFGAPPPA